MNDFILMSEEIKENYSLIRSYIERYFKYFMEIENTDIYKTSVINSMIEVLSKFTEKQLFYSLSAYREFFLTQAKLPESIYNLSSFVGYSPREASPSECDVNFVIRLDFISYEVRIFIEKGFSLLGANSIPFELEKDIKIFVRNNNYVQVLEKDENNDIEVSIPYLIDTTSDVVPNLLFSTKAKQVKTSSKIYGIPPDLKPYQFPTIDVPYSDQLYKIKVEVLLPGESEWKEYKKYDSLYLLLSNDEGFVYRKIAFDDKNKFVRLFFGNDLMGKQPPPGSQIKITIYETMGSMGNLPAYSIISPRSITVVDGTITRTISYVCFNPIGSSGGDDEEKIEEIRESSLVHISTINKLVSERDYKNLKVVDSELNKFRKGIPVLKRSDPIINDIQEYIGIETKYYDSFFDSYIDTLEPFRTEIVDFYVPFIYSEKVIDLSKGQTKMVENDEFQTFLPMKVDFDRNISSYYFNNDNIRCNPNVLFNDNRYGTIDVSSVVIYFDNLNVNFRVNYTSKFSSNVDVKAYVYFPLDNSKYLLNKTDDYFYYVFQNASMIPQSRDGDVNAKIQIYANNSFMYESEIYFKLRNNLENYMISNFEVFTSSRIGMYFNGIYFGPEYHFSDSLTLSGISIPRLWKTDIKKAELNLYFKVDLPDDTKQVSFILKAQKSSNPLRINDYNNVINIGEFLDTTSVVDITVSPDDSTSVSIKIDVLPFLTELNDRFFKLANQSIPEHWLCHPVMFVIDLIESRTSYIISFDKNNPPYLSITYEKGNSEFSENYSPILYCMWDIWKRKFFTNDISEMKIGFRKII